MYGSGNLVVARALCALAAWLLSAAAPALEPQHVAERGASVFRIQTAHAHHRTTSGTAVLVAPHTLVTNCHVVAGAREITVAVGGSTHPARVVRADVERDLCLLAGPTLEAPRAVLGDTVSLRPGATIAAAAYSKRGKLIWSTGQIEGLFSYGSGGRVIQGSAPFDEGASGGGLFDDTGRLVGILTFKARAGGPFHFAVPVEWVTDLLANKVSTPQSSAESAFWQYTDARQPRFLRAASLAAEGDCDALAELAAQWLKQEPASAEAGQAARSAKRCEARMGRVGG